MGYLLECGGGAVVWAIQCFVSPDRLRRLHRRTDRRGKVLAAAAANHGEARVAALQWKLYSEVWA
jgi:hypothetical protein